MINCSQSAATNNKWRINEANRNSTIYTSRGINSDDPIRQFRIVQCVNHVAGPRLLALDIQSYK